MASFVDELHEVISPIASAIGLQIDVYDSRHSLVFSTESSSIYEYEPKKDSDYNNEICVDSASNLTYVRIDKNDLRYYAVLIGSDKVAQNYAVLVRKVIENILNSTNSELDIASRLALYLNHEVVSCVSAIKKFFAKTNFYLLLIKSPKDSQLVIKYLEAAKADEDIIVFIDSTTTLFLKNVIAGEYASGLELANMLDTTIQEEERLSYKIGVGGTAHSLDEIEKFYHNILACINIGTVLSDEQVIYSYKDYALYLCLDEMPKDSISRLVEDLVQGGDLQVLQEDELVHTAEEFLGNAFNTSLTARTLYLHRNTLMYRLDKIEKALGLDITQFQDAFVFKLLLMLYRLNKK